MGTTLDPARLAAVRADIDGSAGKIRHAMKHLGSLRYQANKWLQAQPYDFTQDLDHHDGWSVVRLKVLKEPPDILGLLAGDLVHDLRGALDHVTYQLARLTTDDPIGTQFPIFVSERDYRQPRKGKPSFRDTYLAGVPDEFRAFIDDLQPFQAPNPTEDRLAVLAAFSNIDKHRLINAVYFAPSFDVSLTPVNFSASEFEVRYPPRGAIEDGAEVLRFRPAGDIEIDVGVDPLAIEWEYAPDIAWGPGLVTFTQLHAIWIYVSRIVVTLIGFVQERGLPHPRHDTALLKHPDIEAWVRSSGPFARD
jgi:hypothetical protein